MTPRVVRVDRERRHSRVRGRVEEIAERQQAVLGAVADAVRGQQVPASVRRSASRRDCTRTCPASVRRRSRCRTASTSARASESWAGPVNRPESVYSATPSRRRRRRKQSRGNPEQLHQVGGQVLSEPFSGKAQPEGDAAHHRLGDPTRLVEPAKDDDPRSAGRRERGWRRAGDAARPGGGGRTCSAPNRCPPCGRAAQRRARRDREPPAPRRPPTASRSPPWRAHSGPRRTGAPSVRGRPAASGRRRARRSRRSRSRDTPGRSRSPPMSSSVSCRPGRARARCRRSAGRIQVRTGGGRRCSQLVAYSYRARSFSLVGALPVKPVEVPT